MASVRDILPTDRSTRLLAGSSLVNTFGNGVFYTVSVVYFTQVVGLSAHELAVGLFAAGLAGIAVGIPAGHLADRWGARQLLVALTLLSALAMAAFALVSGFVGFVVVSCVYAVFDRGAGAVRQALIAEVAPSEGRVRTRAYLRSVTNVGMGAGSLVAAVALVVDVPAGYVAVIVLDALTFVGAAALIARLPRSAPSERVAGDPVLPVLRDKPYVAFCLLFAVASVQFTLLEVAVPLWVVTETSAPTWSIAAVMFLNTAVVAVFQVPASRGTEEVGAAAVALRTSGWVVLAACAVFAASAGPGPVLAVVLLLFGALIHVVGEMRQSAGGWGVAYGLAPDALQGQYQGLFSTSMATSHALGPLLVAALPIAFGTAGWIAFGLIVVVASVASVPVSRWGLATRTVAA